MASRVLSRAPTPSRQVAYVGIEIAERLVGGPGVVVGRVFDGGTAEVTRSPLTEDPDREVSASRQAIVVSGAGTAPGRRSRT